MAREDGYWEASCTGALSLALDRWLALDDME